LAFSSLSAGLGDPTHCAGALSPVVLGWSCSGFFHWCLNDVAEKPDVIRTKAVPDSAPVVIDLPESKRLMIGRKITLKTPGTGVLSEMA
jgi:hypothetical protein